MEEKIFLQELCSNLEKELNERSGANKKTKVDFFSGLKPSSYYHQMYISPSMEYSEQKDMAWFVEISVDDKVLFRESYIPKQSHDLNAIEALMINKVLRNIFTMGIMLTKEYSDKNINMKP